VDDRTNAEEHGPSESGALRLVAPLPKRDDARYEGDRTDHVGQLDAARAREAPHRDIQIRQINSEDHESDDDEACSEQMPHVRTLPVLSLVL
jgi:hypothetical protein